MQFSEYIFDKTVAKTSEFNGEIHAIVTVNDSALTFTEQLSEVADGIQKIISKAHVTEVYSYVFFQEFRSCV